MSKLTRELSPDLVVVKVVPAELVEIKQNARTNLQLVAMLKKKFDERKEILFYCECNSDPIDCQCENQRITVQFESDLYLPDGIIEVYLPIPPSYCACTQATEKCFRGTCTNIAQLS